MASIDIGAITSKVSGLLSSSQGEQLISAAVEKELMAKAQQAGDELAGLINKAIGSTGHADTIGSAKVSSISINGTQAVVEINIDKNFRPSLVPEKYGGVDDMAALFNNGYNAGGIVYGMWHGKYVASLPERECALFVQEGIESFNAAKYNATVEYDEGRFT